MVLATCLNALSGWKLTAGDRRPAPRPHTVGPARPPAAPNRLTEKAPAYSETRRVNGNDSPQPAYPALGAIPPSSRSMRSDILSIENKQRERARKRLLEAQQDLNRSVRRLQDDEWASDVPSVRRRLRELEDAADDYSRFDTRGVSDIQWEARRMKSELRRFDSEDWRDVVPDVERRNRRIGWETDELEGDEGY